MIHRILLACALVVVSCAQTMQAQDLLQYREFRLGATLTSVATLTAVTPAAVTVLHQRPALLQDLEWRPRYVSRESAIAPDPVDRMVFSFYNDQLYRVVVDYEPRRTEGMAQADLMAAISATYGVALKPALHANPLEVQYGDPDLLLATWGNAESTLALFRAAYPVRYRLVVQAAQLATLAKTAAAESVRLDLREAPQRELERQQKQTDADLAAAEEAKRVNLPGFRP